MSTELTISELLSTIHVFHEDHDILGAQLIVSPSSKFFELQFQMLL